MWKALLELIRAGASSWSALILATVAGALFLGSWAAIHHGFYAEDRIVDTPLYQRYGDWMLDGNVPYRDFAVEYPPGALPVFALPAIGNSVGNSENAPAGGLRRSFRRNFELLMALCGLATIALVTVCLLELGASNGSMAVALGLISLAPLMLGSLFLSRFDLWPAMLGIAALTAILAERRWLGFGLLGAATAAKIFPAALLPIGAVWVWKREGWRELGYCLGIFAAVLAAFFGPFALIAPGGLADSLVEQLGRPLQVESLGAASMIGLHDLFGFGLSMQSGSGSQNLAGDGALAVSIAQSSLQVAALVGIWVWFSLGEADRERLVRAAAASLVAFVALGKVLSPQFLIWLFPFVVLVRGRRGLAVSGMLALSLALTQLWFPYRYWDYVYDFDAAAAALVLARDLLLLAILAVLLVGGLHRLEANEPAQEHSELSQAKTAA